MAIFEAITTLARPVEEVFEFLAEPANLIRVSPPELHLKLVEGPARLQLGARITVQGRRFGIPHQIVSEVTIFEPNVRVVDEQREGPFKKWVHTHRLEPQANGTRMIDQIDFTPPGGLIGLVLTEGRIKHELQWVFAYRTQKMHELLGGT